MVVSEPNIKTPKKGKPNRKLGYLKMVVMEDLTADSINKKVGKSVEKSASVFTNGYTGYSKLKGKIAHHDIVIEPNKRKSAKIFTWVNRSFSNTKKFIWGIHDNCVNQQFVQNYLDEFVINSIEVISVTGYRIGYQLKL